MAFEKILQLVMEDIDACVWSVDVETGHFILRCKDHDRLFGYREAQQNWSWEAAERYVLDDDKPILRDAAKRARKDPKLWYEVRVRWPDGNIHWLKSTGKLLAAEGGGAGLMVGTVVDVSAEKQLALELCTSRRRLEFLDKLSKALNSHTDPMDLQNAACRVLGQHLGASRVFYCEVDESGWNTAGPQYLNGVDSGADLWKSDEYDDTLIERYRSGHVLCCNDVSRSSGLSDSQQRAYALEQIAAWAAMPITAPGLPLGRLVVHQSTPRNWTGEDLYIIQETAERVWPVVQRARTEAKLRQTTSALERAHAELEKKIAERTSELAAANEALADLARHDELTGLPNRLAANERLHLEFATMKRTRRCYAVLMMDIDHFKHVNDNFGHEVGDHALRRIGAILQGTVRAPDFVCRYGGEEFLALLPDTGAEGAWTAAERIRQAIDGSYEKVAGRLTVSIGIAIASSSQASEDDAVRTADDCLYEAKRLGRNRSVM